MVRKFRGNEKRGKNRRATYAAPWTHLRYGIGEKIHCLTCELGVGMELNWNLLPIAISLGCVMRGKKADYSVRSKKPGDPPKNQVS